MRRPTSPATSGTFQPIGEIVHNVVADLKRQRRVEHLHLLGPRPLLEALIEVAAGVELDAVLADYAGSTPKS